jgi:hypothetical protein
MGDKAILPPPKDVESARKREKEAEGYDWWFRFKKLDS